MKKGKRSKIPAIEVKNLHVAFDGHDVLRSINMRVEENDFYAIIGPNGGGKSVLLKTILGFITPQLGEVTIFGEAQERSTTRIGYVPQFLHYDIAFPISAFDIVMMGRIRANSLGRRYSAADNDLALDALTEVGIDGEVASLPFSALSGGQRQRVIIARALATEPDIFILDEPTSSIDAATNEKVNDLFSKLHEDGKTIVVVTHDIGAISREVTKIACLNTVLFEHGEEGVSGETMKRVYGCNVDLVAHGIPHRVLRHPEHHDHETT